MPAKSWTPERDQLLLRLLAEPQKQKRIAEILGVHIGTVEKRIAWLRRQGISVSTQRTGPRSGEGHPEWKGGRVLDKDGYQMLYMPGHPMARGKYVLEHRLIMAEKLGRMLTPKEVVHHKDKNKLNNHPDNLELFAENSEHLRHELTGKCPQWTEDGKRRIADAVRQYHGSHHWSEPDGPKKPQS